MVNIIISILHWRNKMILGADWDNTIKLNNDVSKTDIEAINNFRKHNKFGVVTGRTLSMIKPELEKYHIDYDFLVCSNGTVVFDENDKLISRIDMNTEQTKELLKYLTDRNMVFCLSDGIDFGYYRLSEKEARFISGFDHKSYEQMLDRPYNGIFVRSDDINVLYDLKAYIENKYDMCGAVNRTNLDIYDIKTNKAIGLNIVAQYYHDDNIYAIGDGGNDLDMIKAYGKMAMKDCSDEVKKIAEIYFESVSDCIKYIEGNNNG